MTSQNLSGFLHGSGTDIAATSSSNAADRRKNATVQKIRDDDDEDEILEESQWCTSHEDHNSQMHAIHGNTKSVTTKTTPKPAPAKATLPAQSSPPAKPPATEKKQTAKEKAAEKKAAALIAAADAARMQAEQDLDGIVSHVCRTFGPAKAAEYAVGQVLLHASDGDIVGKIKQKILALQVYTDPNADDFPKDLSDKSKQWVEGYIANLVTYMTRHQPVPRQPADTHTQAPVPEPADPMKDIPIVLHDPATAVTVSQKDITIDEMSKEMMENEKISNRPQKVSQTFTAIPETVTSPAWLALRAELLLWLSVNFRNGCTRSLVYSSLIASFAPNLKSKFMTFMNPVELKSPKEIVAWMDIQFSSTQENESVNAIQDFKTFMRSDGESLSSALLRFQGIFNRALTVGYQPASDIPEFLVNVMKIGVTQRAEIEGKLIVIGKTLTTHQKLNYIFHTLTEFGRATDAAKRSQKNAETNMKLKKSGVTAVSRQNAGKLKKIKKKPKGKGKGKGAKVATGTEQANQVPVATTYDQNFVAAVANAMWGFTPENFVTFAMKGKGKDSKGKGKGKGKGKKGAMLWENQYQYNIRSDPRPPKGWTAEKDWICDLKTGGCGGFNYRSKEKCYHCNKPRPAHVKTVKAEQKTEE